MNGGTYGPPVRADKKEAKRLRILNYVRNEISVSRSEIAAALGLDKKSVSVIIDELIHEKLVFLAGFRDSQAGRRQELLSINGVHSNYIGIDLGATHIIGVRTDLNGRVLDRISFDIRPGLSVEIIIEQIKSIAATLQASDAGTSDIAALGVDLPGFVDPIRGISLMAENIPGWNEINIRAILEESVGRPVYVADCSRTMGLAERWMGKGGDVDDFLVLDLGYGIGMAMFLDGIPYSGAGFKSGEIGHTVVEPDGPLCTCGKNGCLEVFASGRGIALFAEALVKEGRSEILAELIHGDAKTVTAQDVAVAASMNDTLSLELLTNAGSYIGTALSHAVNILNPRKIILGGGLTGAGKPLFDNIHVALQTHTMKGIMDDVVVELSELGVETSALGSALLAMEHTYSPQSRYEI